MDEFADNYFRLVFNILQQMQDASIRDWVDGKQTSEIEAVDGAIVEDENHNIHFDTNLAHNEEERKYICTIMEDFHIQVIDFYSRNNVIYYIHKVFYSYFTNASIEEQKSALANLTVFNDNGYKNEDVYDMLDFCSAVVLSDIIALLTFMVNTNISLEDKMIFYNLLTAFNDYMHTIPLDNGNYTAIYNDPQSYTIRPFLHFEDNDTLSD